MVPRIVQVTGGLVSWLNGISTFDVYLMPNPVYIYIYIYKYTWFLSEYLVGNFIFKGV